MERELIRGRLLSGEDKLYNKGMLLRDALKRYAESMTRIPDGHELKSIELDGIVSDSGELLDKNRMVDLLRLEYPNMLFIFYYTLSILHLYSEKELREISANSIEITNILVKRTIEDLSEFFPLSEQDFDSVDFDCSQRSEISFHVNLKMSESFLNAHAEDLMQAFRDGEPVEKLH